MNAKVRANGNEEKTIAKQSHKWIQETWQDISDNGTQENDADISFYILANLSHNFINQIGSKLISISNKRFHIWPLQYQILFSQIASYI